jgi:hypothetical protein
VVELHVELFSRMLRSDNSRLLRQQLAAGRDYGRSTATSARIGHRTHNIIGERRVLCSVAS